MTGEPTGAAPAPVSPSGPAGWPGVGWWLLAGAGYLLSALLLILPAYSGPWIFLARGTTAGCLLVMAVAIARMRPGARAVWWGLAGFLLLTWLGDLVYDYLWLVLDVEPFPSPADALYLPAYACAVLALYTLLRRARPAGHADLVAGSLLLALAASALTLALFVAPILDSLPVSGSDALAVVYPLLDLGIIAMIVRLFSEIPSWRLPLILISVSFGSFLVADIAYYADVLYGLPPGTQTWLELLYVLPGVLMALAVTAPGAAALADPPAATARVGLPRMLAWSAAAATVPALVVIEAARTAQPMILVLGLISVVVILLVLAWVRRLLASLSRSQERYRLLAENSSDFVLMVSRDRVIQWASPSITAILGWAPADVVGHLTAEFVHPEQIPGLVPEWDRVDAGEVVSGRIEARCADGSYRWLARSLRPVRDSRGEVIGHVAGFHDVQSEVETERALARSERRFRLAMEYAPTGMALVGLDRRFVAVNPALCRMLGRDPDWLLARSVRDVVDPRDEAADERQRRAALDGNKDALETDLRLVTADGREVLAEHSLGVLRDEEGRALSFVSQFVDVTEARRSRADLHHLATHDGLTGLSNRSHLIEELQAQLGRPALPGQVLGLLFIDLDGLKMVNDRYGHQAGDRLILHVADRIQERVRGTDVVARIGGDEFVVVLPRLRRRADAQEIAVDIDAALADPVQVAPGTRVQAGVSIGIALAEAGDDCDRLLARADQAMYEVKQERRRRGGLASRASAEGGAPR